jgi:hypothetical protein
MNRIHIKGPYEAEELVAAGTVKPGHLCLLDSNGKTSVHATAGGFAERLVAFEDALQGKALADSYVATDIVSLAKMAPGSECYMFLKAGANVAIGAKLVSAGDGTLIEDTEVASGVTVKQIIGIALEAKDLSGSGAVDTRIKVRVV